MSSETPRIGQETHIVALRGRLQRIDAVDDCHAIVRNDRDGAPLLVVFVVAPLGVDLEAVSTRAREVLRDALPVVCTRVTTIPRRPDGTVDEDALCALPVVTPRVRAELESRLHGLEGVADGAVVLEEHRRAPASLHLEDICPGWTRGPVAVDEATATEATVSVTPAPQRDRPLAYVHGGPLDGVEERFSALSEVLERAAELGAGRRVTFIGPEGEELVWSYAELLAAAQRIAGGLEALGLRPRAYVVLLLEHNQEVLSAFWACLLGGFIPLVMEVPTSFTPKSRPFDHLCKVCEMLGGPLLLTSDALRPRAERVATEVSGVAVRIAGLADLAGSPTTDPAPRRYASPEEVAFLCFSSGSTGVPKCVQLTHECVLRRNDGTNLLNDHRSDDVNLNWLPFDHIGSITEHIRSMQLRCDLVYVTKDAILENPLNLLDVIDGHRVTHTWGPNFIYALIRERLEDLDAEEHRWDLSCVRFLISGGEAASFAMMRGFLDCAARYGFPATGFRPSFGMVEVSAGITYYAPTLDASLGFLWLARAGAYGQPIEQVAQETPGAKTYALLGRPLPGCELRVVDADDTVLREQTVGRVQVRGAALAAGYLNNPALNERVFLDDGWFETDDLGFLTDGNLVLTGRTKEMLILNGVNYYSRELEDIVEAVDGVEVSFTAACAVTAPTGDREHLALFLHTPRSEPSERRALLRAIRQTLVERAHINPAFIIPVERDEIPKTPIGKIQRLELSKRFQRGLFAAHLKRVDRLLGNENTVPAWFFRTAWRPAKATSRELPTGLTLVLAAPSATHAELLLSARARDIPVMLCAPGSTFSTGAHGMTVDPTRRDQLAQMLRTAGEQREISNIVCLWDREAESVDEPDLERLLALLQAISDVLAGRPVRLLYVDRESQAVTAGEPVAPARACRRALLATSAHELLQVTAVHVDVTEDDALVDCVLAELVSSAKDPEVAYRRGARQVLRLDQVHEAEFGRTPAIPEGSAHLLLGGLGGLGQRLAAHLLRQYNARIVLTGRRAVADDDPALVALRRLGGQVRYVQADCRDAEAMRRALAALEGPVHTAWFLVGTAAERLLVDETALGVVEALTPLREGADMLADLVAGTPDARLVYCACVTGRLGAFAGAAQSAASTYLEVLAGEQRRRGVDARCVAWTQWDHLGVNQGRAQSDRPQAQRGLLTITADRGLASWIAAHSLPAGDLMIGLDGANPAIAARTTAPAESVEHARAYVALDVGAQAPRTLEGRDEVGEALSCAIEVREALPRGRDGEVDRAALARSGAEGLLHVAPQSPLEHTLVEIWRGVLRVDVGIHDNFFEAGGDSIKAVMAMNQLQDRLGGIFHPVSIFDAPTVARLAVYIEENYPQLFVVPESTPQADGRGISAATREHMRRYLAGALSGATADVDERGTQNRPAVFILSPARSGSTLLRVMLAGNPRLFSPPELYLMGFAGMAERRDAYSGRRAFLREGLARALMALRSCSLDQAEEFMRDLEERDVPVKEVYAQLQSWLDGRILVDKTPPYAFNPAILRRLEAEFEDAHFIHLQRHPAGMLHSFEEARVDLAVAVHGDEDAGIELTIREKGELWWQISHENIVDFLATIPRERQHAVRFEDLVTRPSEVLTELCGFLGIDFHEDMLAPQRDPTARMTDAATHFSKLAGDPKFHQHRGISAAAADRWRASAVPFAFADATWRLAERFGYARAPAAAPGQAPIKPDLARRHEPFPLTDIQQAYWAGRSSAFELGGRSVHSYTEVEGIDLDLARLNGAWRLMIARHEMLRTIILADGAQMILESTPPFAIAVDDLRTLAAGAREDRLEQTRDQMSHQLLRCDRWPTFDLRLSLLPEGRARLHMSFDAIFFDARSKYILFSELRALYNAPDRPLAPLELSFRDYVLREQELKRTPAYERAKAYWVAQLDDLPPAPELPLAARPRALETPRFFQKNHMIEGARWARLKHAAAGAQITPSCLLLAVFADALRVWSKRERFTLNITAYRRMPLHPQVNDVIGDFSSLILMAIDAPGAADFTSRAQALQQRLMSHLHQGLFSGLEVLRELARRSGSRGGASMPVVFTSVLGDELQEPNERPLDWLGEVVFNVTQTPQIWFDHIAFEEGGELLCRWNVVEGLFPPGLADSLFDAYLRHLTRLADDPASWRETWRETHRQLLPPAQLIARARLNDTAAAVPTQLLHEHFFATARAHPERAAVLGAQKITYGALAEHANRLGRRLRELGAQPNTLVAVALDKGWEQVAAVLGVLASGAAYLPLDPGLPDSRFSHLLERGEVRLVVTERRVRPLLAAPDGVEVLCVDDPEVQATSSAPLDPVSKHSDLAYVIFTSGSTGQPKGVMIDHRGASNTILDINQRFAVGPEDRVLALSALSFDLSVYDIFGLLAAGGAIVMPPTSALREPCRWVDFIAEHRVTLWNTVPAFMGVLMEHIDGRDASRLASLRLVLMSGDWIPLALPGVIAAKIPGAACVSLGGATEGSIWSILYPIGRVAPHWKSIPYGRPMANQTFHVLGESLDPCPEWVPGMLYIGGVGVARGYWRDPERTSASFIEHPRTGERLYRTGDFGRFVPSADGPYIEFLGREDLQVKVQGFRVELGEIEASLEGHPDVERAAVVAHGERHADKQLVAYVVAARSQSEEELTDALRRHLKRSLPYYMVPTRYVALDRLPLSANGKVDRAALPAPTIRAAIEATPGVRRGDTTLDARLAEIVASILGIPEVPANESLFNLGATSIDIMSVANQVEKELGLRVAVDAIYDAPTVRGIAQQLALASSESEGSSADNGLPLPREYLERLPPLLDVEARRRFKDAQLGVRDLEGSGVPLLAPPAPELDTLLEQRRSRRHFAAAPVPLLALAELLACLRQHSSGGAPKYLYASAGGLYPVQTYIYVKPGRVAGLAGGAYYYHPREHRLVHVAAEELDERTYNAHINRPIWRRAAFAVFFVVELGAIVPIYREHSLHFAAIEAGLMSQLLAMRAAAAKIALCQIGQVSFDRVRELFRLSDTHAHAHALLGGGLDPALAEDESLWNDLGAPAEDADTGLESRVEEEF